MGAGSVICVDDFDKVSIILVCLPITSVLTESTILVNLATLRLTASKIFRTAYVDIFIGKCILQIAASV